MLLSTSEPRASQTGERLSVFDVPLAFAPVSRLPSSVSSCASALPVLPTLPNPLDGLDKGGPLATSDPEDKEDADPITLTIGENGRAPYRPGLERGVSGRRGPNGESSSRSTAGVWHALVLAEAGPDPGADERPKGGV